MADDTTDTTLPPDDPAPASEAPDIAEAVAKALDKTLAPMGKAFQSLAARVEAMETGRRAPPADDPPAGRAPTTPADFLDNPDDYIDRRIAERIKANNKDVMAPLLQPVFDDKAVAVVEAEASRFDATYGEGKFDELIRPELEEMIKAFTPAQAVSVRHMRLAVNSIKGQDEKVEALLEARGTVTKERAERPPPMMPGGRQVPRAPTISPEDLEFINEHARVTGKPIDRKQWLADADVPGDEDSWRAHLAKGKGATK